jgi:hypothetical protein
LESNNVQIAWMKGWVAEMYLPTGGRYLPGMYGNHAFGWGLNLAQHIVRAAREPGPPWWSLLKIWASQPNTSAPPVRNRAHSGIPFAVRDLSSSRIPPLPTAMWQAWHSLRFDPGQPKVDIDVATEDGYQDMY